jgi:adenylate cyclase
VDKFIGDALMAFWNAPLPTPDHARQACEAALAMFKELELLNSFWLQRGLPTLRIGIGIHCGLARVGNMGSKQRFEYTVIGDSVNLASRLEGLTKFYNAEILVSSTICDALHKDYLFRQVDTVRVQGKTEPVTVCQLLGRRDALDARIEEELQCWHEAFAYYSDGDFPAAELLLRHLADRQPEDSLYSMYLKRCRCLAPAPPEHWDGITDLRSK